MIRKFDFKLIYGTLNTKSSKIDIHKISTYRAVFSRDRPLYFHLPTFVPSCCDEQIPTLRVQEAQIITTRRSKHIV